MKKLNKYNFGLIFGKEKLGLYKALKNLSNNFKSINIIEVGFNEGITGKALVEICKDLGSSIDYYGIDIKEHQKMLKNDNMTLIIEDANNEKILDRLPEKFHFVFIDSCHCYNCVTKQYKIYSRRLVKNGIIGFHDTNESFQGTKLTEPHSSDKDYYCEVRKAIGNLDLSDYKEFFKFEKNNGLILWKKY